MTDATVDELEPPKKRSKLPLILGVVLAIAGGGGGFFAVSSGLILGDAAPEDAAEEHVEADPIPQVSFVPMDPLLISLPPGASARYLRFTGQLEVEEQYAAEVQAMMPRVVDALNDYLRLVTIAELQDPAKILMLRAQMLRRVQLVVGDGRVKDLLIMEFLLD